jgi:hypothetical protein
MMPWDVLTWWNSTFDMLEFTIQYCVAINAMTAVWEFNLHKYELAPTEWNTAVELQDILKVSNLPLLSLAHSHHFIQIFKDATLFFSHGTPNLATVILAMDLIDKVLTTLSISPSKYSLAICAALTISKKTLNKYYNKTGESEVYRIAMSMFCP